MTIVLVMCTVPDPATAERLALALLDAQLAACVSLQPAGESYYRWEGRLERACEHTLFIKTTAEACPALETALREMHPYEVPEILVFPASGGLPAYLKWVSDSVIARSDQSGHAEDGLDSRSE